MQLEDLKTDLEQDRAKADAAAAKTTVAVVQAAMGRTDTHLHEFRAGGAGFRGPANPKRPKAHPEHRHRPRPWPDAYAFRGYLNNAGSNFSGNQQMLDRLSRGGSIFHAISR